MRRFDAVSWDLVLAAAVIGGLGAALVNVVANVVERNWQRQHEVDQAAVEDARRIRDRRADRVYPLLIEVNRGLLRLADIVSVLPHRPRSFIKAVDEHVEMWRQVDEVRAALLIEVEGVEGYQALRHFSEQLQAFQVTVATWDDEPNEQTKATLWPELLKDAAALEGGIDGAINEVGKLFRRLEQPIRTRGDIAADVTAEDREHTPPR